MPAKRKTTSPIKRILVKLNPNGPTKKLITFVVIFAVLTGGYFLYRSYAATCTSYTFVPGSTGQCVKNIQYIINGLNYEYEFAGNGSVRLQIDGQYGNITSLVVAAYQKDSPEGLLDYRLTADGKVGKNTWHNLCQDAAWKFYGDAREPLVLRQMYFAAIVSGCTAH